MAHIGFVNAGPGWVPLTRQDLGSLRDQIDKWLKTHPASK